IDIEPDGDIDVLGAAYGDGITWWENDGNENFTEHTIASDFSSAWSVYAIDIEPDGDVDVLGAAFVADDITWWENDGNENFTEHTIADSFDVARCVYAIDLDGDNDVDVLGAAQNADDITWWENDGDENFTEHIIDASFDGAHSVYAIDMEPDGDVDVLGAALIADDITWWENDGNENFTKHTIAANFDGAQSVFAIDLDNDNDIDVLGAASDADDITWWENDGDENFTKHTIDGYFDKARSVYAIDLDNDSDVDVLGAAGAANDITWWENDDGDTTWTKHIIDADFAGATSVYAIDLDSDLDVDVLGAAYSADDIVWWESDLVITHDAGPASIDVPSTMSEGTILNPQATVANFGINSETFDIICEIDPGAYTSIETVTDLAPNDSIQVTFPDGFTFVIGPYTVTVYTQLVGDEHPENDTLKKEVEAIRIDVGPVSIDIPLTVPADTTLNPQATVTNFGSDSASFDVTCEIDPGEYTSTETVTSLPPDDSIQITFPDGFTFESGSYTVTIYTQLVDDINPINDTLTKIIETICLDVSTISIDIPATLPEDTTLNPQATVTNFGSDSSSFDITCEIDPGEFTSTETVTDLAPDDSIQVIFPDEFTFESGSYTVTVYTQLAGDDHPENDTLEKVIEATGIVEENIVTPTFFSFGLRSNPTKGQAIFHLALSDDATISISIYDVSGRLIDRLITGRKSAGHYDIPWTSRSTAGVYFYKLESPWKNEVGKLVLIR
ncbi:hypothetical protein AMJ52_03305, partial [candidate division TA06 bacterium DG_78]